MKGPEMLRIFSDHVKMSKHLVKKFPFAIEYVSDRYKT